MLQQNEHELVEKVECYALVQEQIDAQIEILKNREESLKIVRKRLEKKQEDLKSRLKEAMIQLNLNKLDGVSCYFKFAKSRPSLDCDERLVPPEFKIETIVTTIDKPAIIKILEQGDEVTGCHLIHNNSLRRFIK